MLAAALLLLVQTALPVPPGEEPVDPYPVSDANAGGTPTGDARLFAVFGGRPGIDRIVADLMRRNETDPRIADIFKAQDMVRLRRTLGEQLCYLLGGGCAYTGRTMKQSHADLGIQNADMNALVENLQAAMRAEGVPFWAQNRLLAKLAPMRRDVVER